MGFVNIDLELLEKYSGQEIEYYELWNTEDGDFRRGSAFIHGIYKHSDGTTRVYSDRIWGSDLDATYIDEEGLLCFPDSSYIYLSPAPFRIYRIYFESELGISEERLVPAETEIDLDMIARSITKGKFVARRVNLDGSDYHQEQSFF